MESSENSLLNPQISSTASESARAPPTTSSTDLIKSVDDKKRIAQLEHEIFTVCKQLDEKTEKLKETQEQNAVFKERISSLEDDKLQKTQFIESIVQSRDNLIVEKTQLQNDKLSLERRKDELESQMSKFTNDKRRHLDEIDLLRKQCDSLKTDKIELQAQIDDFCSEKAALAYDKELWSREKNVLLMSKQWCMNEISNREQKINELRIDMIREKSAAQRDNTQLKELNDELEHKVEQLTNSLQEHEKEFAELQEKFKKVVDENFARINELEAEMRTRERLAGVYKEAQEAAEKEVDELKENEARLETLLEEKSEIIQNMATELENSKAAQEKEIKEKEEEIKRLSEEVTKSTELLNAGFRLNRPDEDIVRLSPAAAAASSLLRSGMSLTSIYAEHCRVVSEYEKKCAEYNILERQVTELIQELDTRAPQLHEKRKAYDQMCEKNQCLILQNELLSQERQKLQARSDAYQRELTFTQRELERYQREHQTLTLQVQRLLYVIEKGDGALHHSQMNGDSASDQYLFSNIKELQAKNIELAEELERLRDEQEKIIENYHNTEIEALKQACKHSQDELIRVKENYGKQELLIRELTEQRDQYKADQLATAANAPGISSNVSTASEGGGHQSPQTLGSLQADLVMWKTKAERLQETLSYLNEDRQKHEGILNSRIDQQLEQISSMRMTIGKLESDLEFQNKNQQLLAKQIDSYALDLKRSKDQLADAKRQLETCEFKCDSLTNQLLEKQQEVSTYRVQNHSISEQLQIVTSREQRLQAELEILRSSHYSTERVTTTLQEMESLLKRVNEEKMHSIESQLQSTLLERDNLRQLVDSLNEQHNHLVNGLKTNLNAACNERDKAQAEYKSLQNRLDALERVYEQLKKEHEKLQNEMEQVQSTDTNIEACKKEMQKLRNTIAYQEKQLAEFDQKCEELNSTIDRKDKQLEEICRLGTDMESSIQYGTLERQRMQAVREQLEAELKTSKNTIEELRNTIAAKEIEQLEQSKLLSEAKNNLEQLNTTFEQQQLELQKQVHERNLQNEQLLKENQKLKSDLENITTRQTELTENCLRLTTELANEVAKCEKIAREKSALVAESETKCEKLQRSLASLEQEKLGLQDEIKSFMERDKEHVEKRDTLYEEIQRLLKQVEFMERLQNTIASPSPNTSLNASAMTQATFSPIASRLSVGETSAIQQQQQTDRINAIIGYMRTEKQKETELRMNAELDLQRIRAQASMDQQRIVDLDMEVAKLRTEAEANAKAALEKEQLMIRLNALNEIQARYQNLKKSFDELSQNYALLGQRTKEMEEQHIKMQAEEKNLGACLESATKMAEDRAQQIKLLRERCDKAMAMASKYSPEVVNSLQGDNEKLKSDMAQKDRDLDLLKKECERYSQEMAKNKHEHGEEIKTWEEKYKFNNTQLLTVKQLARKLRDEKTVLSNENSKLQNELKSIQDELLKQRETATTVAASSPSTSTLNVPTSTVSTGGANVTPAMRRQFNEQVMRLTKENEMLNAKLASLKELEEDHTKLRTQIQNLQTQLAEKQQELDDAQEKVMRIEMVEKALKNSQQRVQTLTMEIRQREEENDQLRKKAQELERQMAAYKERNAASTSTAPSMQFPEPSSQVFNFYDESMGAADSQQAQLKRSAPPHQSEVQPDSSQQFLDSPQSPLQGQESSNSYNKDPNLEAIIDELDREDVAEPSGELAEGILDIDEGDEAAARYDMPDDGEVGASGQEEAAYPDDDIHTLGEVASENADDKGEAERVMAGFDGGNEMTSEGTASREQQLEPQPYEVVGEEGEHEIEELQGGDEEDADDEDESIDEDEEEYMDEEEDEDGGEGEFFEADEDAEGEDEEEGDHIHRMTGEPPRKQRRMQNEQPKDADPSAEDDDDDDIQLL